MTYLHNKRNIHFQGASLTALVIVGATIGIILGLRYKRNQGRAFVILQTP